MSGYEDYKKALGYGPSEEQMKKRIAEGITIKNLRFDGKDNQWDGTVYFKDCKPFRISFYIWKASDEKIHEGLSDVLDVPVKLKNWSGGNGHYSADIVINTERAIDDQS